MALDQETRGWIANDLASMIFTEFLRMREILEGPDDNPHKKRMLIFGPPEKHANDLLQAAHRRYSWITDHLQTNGGRWSLLHTIEQLNEYIADLSVAEVQKK